MQTKAKSKRDAMYERTAQHGRDLLAIFPYSTERDPVQLCKKLRKLERLAASIGLQLCNGPQMTEQAQEQRIDHVLEKVDALLRHGQTVPVFVNLDPRGYALKIDNESMRARPAIRLHTDWGGYGIIAPDLSEGE